MKKLWVFFSITLYLAMSAPGHAAAPDVMTIINKMKQVHESAFEMAQKINIQIEFNGKVFKKMVAGRAQKQLSTGKHALMVLLEPEVMRGFSVLYKEIDNMTVDRWIYLPAINRIRRLTGPWSAYDSFLNTDFNYADLGFVETKGEYKLLGEENIGDTPTYKVEKIPDSPIRYYARIITWISKKSYLPLRRDYYDIADNLYKRQLFENIFMVGKTPIAYKVSMTNLQAHSKTVLSIHSLKTGLDLPDHMFTPERLYYSATCPIWERVCYPSERVRNRKK